MTDIHGYCDIVARMALAHPDTAFEILATIGGEEAKAEYEPTMIDADGSAREALRVRSALMDGGYVTTAEYPEGTTAITLGGETTVMERIRRGAEIGRWRYLFEPRLEHYRATGRLGVVYDLHSQDVLDMLRMHGVLAEHGLDPEGPEDAGYRAFLEEKGAVGI